MVEEQEGIVVDRNSFIEAQRKIYRKHHKLRGTLVDVSPHLEYTKLMDKSIAKSIFESICSTYEGNQQVKNVKANQLVHQHELLRIKEDEDIETMYSRFQTLVSGLQILNKIYTVLDHIMKIIRSHLARLRPKVATIYEAKDLNKLSLEKMIYYIKRHEIKLIVDEHTNKPKSIALTSKGKSAISLQVVELEEETHDRGSNNDSDLEETTFFPKRFDYLTNKKRFSGRNCGLEGSSFKNQKKD